MSENMESNFVSMRAAVEFLDVKDQYCYNEDLHCTFKFNDYVSQEGDRIAIFKLGWSFVKDYVVFEWAPIGLREMSHTVVFSKHVLPKNTTDIYQLCYISGENELHGASSPLQFCSSQTQSMSVSSFLGSNIITTDSMCKSKISVDQEKDLQINMLKEENLLLKESLKALLAVHKDDSYKNYDKDIQELKEVQENMKLALTMQQKEIDILKSKIVEGGEEYRKLYLEKVKVEKKYEKLKNRNSEEKQVNINEEIKFDIGELKSIPPFPFSK